MLPLTSLHALCMFLSRQVCTRLDLLHPSLEETVSNKQAQQKFYYDLHAHKRELFVGQRVMARSPPPGVQWVPGTIVQQTGPLSYLVKVSGDRLWRRHIDHLRGMIDSPQNPA